MMRIAWLGHLVVTFAACEPIIVDPVSSKQGEFKLMLLVPGGKVPPEDYLPLVKGTQGKSQLKLAAGIPRCHINLCDAIFEVPKLLKAIIAQVNKTRGGKLQAADVFITGHSLGGVGARHFFDTWPGAAGLALFGTQYNGDHEDYKGTLGYPVELKSFPGPMLALTGELDMLPYSHTAELVRQWNAMGKPLQKLPIIIEGMDHSQFCPPFNVSGDLVPEISNEAATAASSEIVGAWLDFVVRGESDKAAADLLHQYVEKTAPMAAAFVTAMERDQNWCVAAQALMMHSPRNLVVEAVHRYSAASVEHCHPNSSLADGVLTATVCDYRFYSYTNGTLPNFAPVYQGAQDISCKMISEDKLAKELNLGPVDMKSSEVANRCKLLNQLAFDESKRIVSATWPKAVKRFQAQGKRVVFDDDSQATIGPQWVLSSLGFKETSTEVHVQSEALISPLDSKIYPGNHYCKLLAPSKAVELIISRGLMNRYASAVQKLSEPLAFVV